MVYASSIYLFIVLKYVSISQELVYQIFFLLSTTFFIFFKKIVPLNFITLLISLLVQFLIL